MNNRILNLLLQVTPGNYPKYELNFIHYNNKDKRLEATDTKRLLLCNIEGKASKNVYFLPDSLKFLTAIKYKNANFSIIEENDIVFLNVKVSLKIANTELITVSKLYCSPIFPILTKFRIDMGLLNK